MITASDRLADIVLAHPDTARVFERHAIDYCCNGDRSLADACHARGLDAGELTVELAAETSRPTAGVTAGGADDVGRLIGHIVATHHTYLRRELPRLHDLMDRVIAAHGTAHPEVQRVAALLRDITDDLLPHLVKEERVLFPMAIELLGAVAPTSFHCGSVRNPIAMMHVEHDRVGELLSALRASTGAYTPPADACPTWHALYAGLAELEHDTHVHVHLENHALFPAIAALESALAAG